jgi:hypothetical protein
MSDLDTLDLDASYIEMEEEDAFSVVNCSVDANGTWYLNVSGNITDCPQSIGEDHFCLWPKAKLAAKGLESTF